MKNLSDSAVEWQLSKKQFGGLNMYRTLKVLIATAIIAGLLALVAGADAQAPADPLAQGFLDPPDSARPRTWWHWTASNVTIEGSKQGLAREAMPAAGEPVLGPLAYYMHKGGHGRIPSDWELFVQFLKTHL